MNHEHRLVCSVAPQWSAQRAAGTQQQTLAVAGSESGPVSVLAEAAVVSLVVVVLQCCSAAVLQWRCCQAAEDLGTSHPTGQAGAHS